MALQLRSFCAWYHPVSKERESCQEFSFCALQGAERAPALPPGAWQPRTDSGMRQLQLGWCVNNFPCLCLPAIGLLVVKALRPPFVGRGLVL